MRSGCRSQPQGRRWGSWNGDPPPIPFSFTPEEPPLLFTAPQGPQPSPAASARPRLGWPRPSTGGFSSPAPTPPHHYGFTLLLRPATGREWGSPGWGDIPCWWWWCPYPRQKGLCTPALPAQEPGVSRVFQVTGGAGAPCEGPAGFLGSCRPGGHKLPVRLGTEPWLESRRLGRKRHWEREAFPRSWEVLGHGWHCRGTGHGMELLVGVWLPLWWCSGTL